MAKLYPGSAGWANKYGAAGGGCLKRHQHPARALVLNRFRQRFCSPPSLSSRVVDVPAPSSSTVSTAGRVTFYRLELVEGQPTRYRMDGREYDMIGETVTVGNRFPG